MRLRMPRRRLRARTRGQAMTETVTLTFFMLFWGGSMMYFFPDSFNALQIYMDSFYYILSLPIP
jgi:membrane-anchored protein YejM (alkaline phosphatase superfamily)